MIKRRNSKEIEIETYVEKNKAEEVFFCKTQRSLRFNYRKWRNTNY